MMYLNRYARNTLKVEFYSLHMALRVITLLRRRTFLLLLSLLIASSVVYSNIPYAHHVDIYRQLPQVIHMNQNLNLASLREGSQQHIAQTAVSNADRVPASVRRLSKPRTGKKTAVVRWKSSATMVTNDSYPQAEQQQPIPDPPLAAIPNGSHTKSSPVTGPGFGPLHGLAPHQHLSTYNVSLLSCDKVNAASFQTEIFCLSDNQDVISHLFKPSKYGLCFVEGAEPVNEMEQCRCKPGWHGQYCSTPDLVEYSNYPYEYGVKIREVPVRVIYGFPFLHEFEMLEARLHELGHLVDVFIIVESNYTAYGEGKPMLLLEKLKEGYLKEYHSKLFHIILDHFPEEAHKNGWVMDELLRHIIGLRGVSAVKNLRKDDIFVLTDADEIPVWETIFFLKYHLGYPEPVGFNLRHNVYGFFWQGNDNISHVFGACSIEMLQRVFDNNPYHLRSATHYMHHESAKTDNYKYKLGGRVHEWSFGRDVQSCGWHCSWCLRPDNIRFKLLAAHSSDEPRWGSDFTKTEIPYIEKLIEDGVWFDDKTKHIKVTDVESRWYAPAYLMQHPHIAPHILFQKNKIIKS